LLFALLLAADLDAVRPPVLVSKVVFLFAREIWGVEDCWLINCKFLDDLYAVWLPRYAIPASLLELAANFLGDCLPTRAYESYLLDYSIPSKSFIT